ncbi:hypothetical protein E3N88_14823 [Mikania micrantha]|uniref:OTU domain-containing protein n=1 Tax=Mikania micrantha TaxID=192012 RepID=A0A5N6P4H5_9ASTR|nr:hypothetical protein E3N88_14823 [Mikania micrantha]
MNAGRGGRWSVEVSDLNELVGGGDMGSMWLKIWNLSLEENDDGNCGFRLVAVGLGFEENQWAFIKQQHFQELDFNADLYKYVFNSYVSGSYDVLRNSINWQQIAPAPSEHWMFMPHTCLVIAQRFGVIVHLFNNRGAQSIFPLWTSANGLMRHNVVSVVHLGVHFINVSLQ